MSRPGRGAPTPTLHACIRSGGGGAARVADGGTVWFYGIILFGLGAQSVHAIFQDCFK